MTISRRSVLAGISGAALATNARAQSVFEIFSREGLVHRTLPLRELAEATPLGQALYKLEVKYTTTIFADQPVFHRSYNGQTTGPIIRAKPGDLLSVMLANSLPSKPSIQADHMGHSTNNYNTTNLHVHGLHVSPKGDSDNVFLDIYPGEHFRYQYKIPNDHPCGTFWYHAHRHGSVALQLASGMAGPLIIEGGLDNAVPLKGISDRILLFQQFIYSKRPENTCWEVLPDDVYGAGSALTDTATTVNGQIAPTITMRPGELQRWRLIHAGLRRTLNVNLESHQLHQIAVDGIPTDQLQSRDWIELQPGYRSDVLILAGKAGTYFLRSEIIDSARAIRQLAGRTTYLAKVVVEGAPAGQSLPHGGDLKGYNPFKDITDDEVVQRRQITLQAADGNYLINGKSFDHNDQSIQIKLNSAEEWSIKSIMDGHPFHIHVNPFQHLAMKQGLGRIWRDTLFVSEGETAVIRIRFKDFPGRSVMHCHILDHEDKGMMMPFSIF